MPLFVPVGHWFLFDAGRRLSYFIPANKAMISLMPFVPLVAYGVCTGGDTSEVYLLALVLVFNKWVHSLHSTQQWHGLLL